MDKIYNFAVNIQRKIPVNTLINNVGAHHGASTCNQKCIAVYPDALGVRPNAVYFRLYCTCIIGQGNVFSGMLYFSECSWIVSILPNRD